MKPELIVVMGPMFSGKTSELIRQEHVSHVGKKRTKTFKPQRDTRTPRLCQAHTGKKIPAIEVARASEILEHVSEDVDHVLVDEDQFFSDGHELLQVYETLLRQGKKVTSCGLNLDYLGRPWEQKGPLLLRADVIILLRAVCMVCGEENATHSQRLSKSEDRFAPGNEYEARCFEHFVPPIELTAPLRPGNGSEPRAASQASAPPPA
jgi:thymidine kinase